MMADLVDQHVADDMAQRLVVFGRSREDLSGSDLLGSLADM